MKKIVMHMVKNTIDMNKTYRRNIEENDKYRVLPRDVRKLFYESYEQSNRLSYMVLYDLKKSNDNYSPNALYDKWVIVNEDFYKFYMAIEYVYGGLI